MQRSLFLLIWAVIPGDFALFPLKIGFLMSDRRGKLEKISVLPAPMKILTQVTLSHASACRFVSTARQLIEVSEPV